MDVAFEVSLLRTISSKCGHSNVASTLPDCHVSHSKKISCNFRSIFASRSALFVWQTVFRSVNLECFEDLDEIQFASLLHES